jgi:hypothetical protein
MGAAGLLQLWVPSRTDSKPPGAPPNQDGRGRPTKKVEFRGRKRIRRPFPEWRAGKVQDGCQYNPGNLQPGLQWVLGPRFVIWLKVTWGGTVIRERYQNVGTFLAGSLVKSFFTVYTRASVSLMPLTHGNTPVGWGTVRELRINRGPARGSSGTP